MSRRSERLAQEIQEEVAQIIGGELKDPRLGFITVTRVALAPDLRTARVLVGVLGDPKERDKSLAVLRRSAGFIRRELGQRLRIRHTPEIVIQLDAGLDASERVARLLEQTLPAAGEEGAPPEEPHEEGRAEPEEE